MGKKYNKGRGGSGKRGGTPKHTAKATVKKGSKARLARFGKIAKQGQSGINSAIPNSGLRANIPFRSNKNKAYLRKRDMPP